ncbi:MAG: hypothetical protein IPG16_06715 [Comamonadaceae bacterium]|nr:hypothetical protein [Comamonadaceae bacterium]
MRCWTTTACSRATTPGSNARLFDACERPDDAARRLPAARSSGSIHATLNHLLWGDAMWLGALRGARGGV